VFNRRSALAKLPKPVWLLGWVSLATDAATEAIYPLLPFFLTQILGAGAVSLGIIEGAAEAVNSILKIIAGRVADRSPAKRPIVLVGYGISSAVRPLISIAQSWTHVFTIRMLDRVGKGIRGAPRDAMLAAWATDRTRGRIYGFHRGMDHVGAVVGPTAATLFLYFYPGEYRTLFALTIIPGAIAVLLLFFVKEDNVRLKADTTVTGGASPAPVVSGFSRTGDGTSPAPVVSGFSRTVEPLPREFRNFMLVLALFTLGNSTDAFLLLKLTEAAGGAKYVPLMWAALHVVKASTSIAGGSWSDRVGRRAVIAGGWLIYAAVYAAFAVTNTLTLLLVWFLVYGCYFGLAEGTEKALVADLAPAGRRGFAFGVYNAVLGLGQLAASIVFGLIWSAVSPAAAFVFGATLALIATLALFIVVRPALSRVEGPRPI
jgi:MFS family permease